MKGCYFFGIVSHGDADHRHLRLEDLVGLDGVPKLVENGHLQLAGVAMHIQHLDNDNLRLQVVERDGLLRA